MMSSISTPPCPSTTTPDSLVERLRKRALIRRGISTRKSVQEGRPDRLADLLDEAANELESLYEFYDQY